MQTNTLDLVPSKTLRGVMTYLKPEVYQYIKEVAESEDRTMSNLVARIVTEWVNQRKKSSPDN